MVKETITKKINDAKEKRERFGFSDVSGLFIERFINLLGQANKGAQAFFWSSVVGWILWDKTTLPQDIKSIIRLYALPLGLFSYFVFELLLSNERINRFFKKISGKTELHYDDIIENRADDRDIELYLGTIA